MAAVLRWLSAWPWVIALAACALMVAVAGASTTGLPPVLNIKTYRSPSGEWTATVDPSRREGGGPGSYRIEHNGKLVWEKQLDFTMSDGGISNKGELAGYGYTSGRWGRDGVPDDDGDLVVAIIGPDGTLRGKDVRARKRPSHRELPQPAAEECFLDASHDRFVILSSDGFGFDHKSRREGFSLRTGSRIADEVFGETPSRPKQLPESGARMEPKRRSDLPTVILESRGELNLQCASEGDSPPIDVREFDFDPTGKIGFMSEVDDHHLEFALYTLDGTRQKTLPLTGMDPSACSVLGPVCTGPNRWMLVQFPYGTNERPSPTPVAYLLDPEVGSLTAMPDFICRCGSWDSLEGGDGMFATMGSSHGEHLGIYDHAGKATWSSAIPASSPRDMAISTRREVGILSDNSITVLNHAGQPRMIDLVKSIGQAPQYSSGLERDIDGGWILYDSGGIPSTYRLEANGKLRSKFTPHHKNGRPFSSIGNVRGGPDGRLWTSDRSSLLRLNDEGEVDFIIGRNWDSKALDAINSVAIDLNGNIYAVNADNAAVHVFDPGGKLKRIMNPDPKDFEGGECGHGEITVAGDGSVYYRLDESESGYMKLDANGARVGFRPRVSDEVNDQWHCKPGTLERLVVGYDNAFLANDAGKITKTLDRRADRKWLDHVCAGAIAADGSCVIFAEPSDRDSAIPESLTVFSPAGEPIKTIDIPGDALLPDIATNGKLAIVEDDWSPPRWMLVDLQSGEIRRWEPRLEENAYGIVPFFSPDGKEIWLFSRGAKKLFKFATP